MKFLVCVSAIAFLAAAGHVPGEADVPGQQGSIPSLHEPDPETDTNPADDPRVASTGGDVIAGELPSAGTWLENATRLYYDSGVYLAWRNELGDYAPALLGEAQIKDTNSVQTVTINVPARNDFFLKSSDPGGNHAYFASREAADADQRPVLIVNGRDRYQATRDTYLSSRSATPAGQLSYLIDRDSMLVGFDGYTPTPGDRVQLQLTTTKQYGDHALRVYAPDIAFELPVISARVNPTVVMNIAPADLVDSRRNYRLQGGVGVATISGADKTFISARQALPPADEYVMTTVMQLGTDWPDAGGKIPGLANTGQALNSGGKQNIVNGVNCNNSGWGGKPANGCRWSARTGFRGRSVDRVGLATYFYAVNPSSSHGWSDPWPMSVTVGQWFAIVQRVRVNSVGESDGKLSYWLCTSNGCFPMYNRSDIRWRNVGLKESQVSEAWIDVFCGGSKCGTVQPLPTATYRFKRATVTLGLPDMDALAAEVRTLNGN